MIALAATAIFKAKAPQSAINREFMQITSSSFKNSQPIPEKFTCDGEDINPELAFADVPANAQSLALIVHDPDAPSGDFTHWTVWNIVPDISGIAENSAPQGAVQGVTDFGRTGYSGPCPHNGSHHYHFTLYALDTVLDLGASATKLDIEEAMDGHVLAKAELIGVYEKK